MSEASDQPNEVTTEPQRNAALETARCILMLERRTERERLEAKKVLEERAEARFEEAEIRTERARAENEEALRASELRYRRLFEAAKDGILILDAETGRITDANPFLIELLGFSHHELVGKTVTELSPFKVLESNQTVLEKLQQQEYVRYENLPLETKQGHQIVVEFVGNIYQAGDKKLIQCNLRDVTARRKSEQWLTLLNTCVANLNDIVLVTEATRMDEWGPRIVFVNEAFERITGYTSAEIVGRSPRFLEGKKTDRRILAEILQALADQRPIQRQIINDRKDGTEYWLDIDIVPIFDPAGQCTHFTGIGRDITGTKKTEARFQRLVDCGAQGVFFWTTKGEIIGANDAFLRLVRYTREDLEAGRMDWMAMTPPEYAELNRRELAVVIASGDCVPFEKEFIRKDGTRVPILMGASSFADNPNEGVSFVLDLTERKKLEHQFLRAQRMESIGTLAGGIAHDLNNILAPIMMSIDILKLTASDSQTNVILDTIDISAKRGADIVRQVLSFARGVEGDRIEIQLKDQFKDLETIIKETFPKNIRLDLSLPDKIWMILGDPTQLHQVLMNLCVNARDAMPDGGILSITMENTTLDEQFAAMHLQAKPGEYVAISVTDSGTGIPSAILDKIFEPFFTTKEVGKGTGLGLSTVIAIVKSHHGFVSAYSEFGKGTTFKVYFPAMEGCLEVRKKVAEVASQPRGNRETILLVDDETSILTITSQTLVAFGYLALTATGGAQAVDIYTQHQDKISAVLTDMAMPVMDGEATIRALRKINPAVKIIAASGLTGSGGATKVSAAGVNHFLTKPYTAGTLLKSIRTILDEA
jgi:PAS domain S-box-containing protein